ncbi:MAG TPA: class I SAM-dependent methyltransferase [Verrucomicrobiae bacterium]
MAPTSLEEKDSTIVCQDGQGLEIRATPLRVTRYVAVFEIYSPSLVLRISQVLDNFRISVQGRLLYLGRALVTNVINTGSVLVCEVKLEETGLNLPALDPDSGTSPGLREQFESFLGQWQRFYQVRPEFKDVVGDMQSFLVDLRLWTEQLEMETRASPSGERLESERQLVQELAGPIIGTMDSFVERFESIVATLHSDLQLVHRAYLRRQLHPLLLSSPFAYRCFHKPLGYAGDYEVVNMMLRPPYEGSTLFSQLMNVWLLDQAPVQAHRHRIDWLTRRLQDEALRLRPHGRRGRICSLGCGPAIEVQRFLQAQPREEALEFFLFDFNEETLAYARRALDLIRNARGWAVPVQLVKRSVQQLIKDSAGVARHSPDDTYDFIYCAGLFDYLSDAVCRRLMSIFYERLSPGGLLLATNATDALNQTRPFRRSMEYILDWYLIYRDGAQFRKLAPETIPPDSISVEAEDRAVNLVMEVRKPVDA